MQPKAFCRTGHEAFAVFFLHFFHSPLFSLRVVYTGEWCDLVQQEVIREHEEARNRMLEQCVVCVPGRGAIYLLETRL